MGYLAHILIIAAIYTITAAALDLLVGHTGMMSLAQAAFFGIGAYAMALVTTRLHAPFLVAVAVAILAASALAWLVSVSTIRLNDEYFLIGTFAYQIVLGSIFNNWVEVTGGPLGITVSAQPVLLLFLAREWSFAITTVLVAAGVVLVIQRIIGSPFGRVLHALREDELLCLALGKNPLYFKVMVFIFASCAAAVAGALFGTYLSFVHPASFTIQESILIISMVIIGGAGTRWGPLVGACLLVLLGEGMRFIGLPAAAAANARQIFYGLLVTAALIARPRGVAGEAGVGT